MFTPLDILSIESWILLFTVFILFRLYLHKKWQFLKNIGINHDPPSVMGLGNMSKLIKNPEECDNQHMGCTSQITTTAGQNLPTHHKNLLELATFLTFAKPSPFFANIQLQFFTADFELKKKYGKIYGLYSWVTPKIVIWDTDILKHIFIKEFPNFPDRQKEFTRVGGKIMNTGLTVVSGDRWKRLRHTLSPLFSGSKLKGMMAIMDDCSEKMINNLRKIVKEKDGRFDVKGVYGNYSMDVICAAAFRININSQDGQEKKEIKLAKKLFDNAFFKNPFFWIIALFPSFEKVFAAFNLSLFSSDVIDHFIHLSEFLMRKQSDSDNSHKIDFMKIMLNSEISDDDAKHGVTKGLTRDEIIGNSIIMILASYENVANALSLLSYCIASYDGVQERLNEELQQTLDENDGELTYDGVNDMKYLDMCLKETLRLYNVSPRNVRFCEREITIKGFTIPAGVAVEVPVHGLSHDEEHWEDPWDFKPERFEDMTKIDPMTYLPFGAGPRNCIGMRFALFEVKVAICRLMQHFNFSPCDDTPAPPLELTMKGSVRPKKDIFLRVSPKT